MIQKMFEKYLLKAFNKFNKQFEEYLSSNADVLKTHTEELKKIKEALGRPETDWFTIARYESYGSYSTTDEVKDLFKKTLQEDYFTKEFINLEATNTKELLIIDWISIKTVHYKDWNWTKDIKVINWKEYLFIDLMR